jgi:hypothetical protein
VLNTSGVLIHCKLPNNAGRNLWECTTVYEIWVDAFVSKPVGGYGLSGWIWETVENEFIIKQGPKRLSLEASYPKE